MFLFYFQSSLLLLVLFPVHCVRRSVWSSFSEENGAEDVFDSSSILLWLKSAIELDSLALPVRSLVCMQTGFGCGRFDHGRLGENQVSVSFKLSIEPNLWQIVHRFNFEIEFVNNRCLCIYAIDWSLFISNVNQLFDAHQQRQRNKPGDIS